MKIPLDGLAPTAPTPDPRCTFVVHGIPQPQGSKTAFVRNGRAVLTEGRNAKSRASFAAWRSAVATAASDWIEANGRPAAIDLPCRVQIVFYLPRPASAPKRVQWPAKKPDVDKLARTVLDAITGIVVTDDSRVCSLTVVKRFAADRPAGATITVEVLP